MFLLYVLKLCNFYNLCYCFICVEKHLNSFKTNIKKGNTNFTITFRSKKFSCKFLTLIENVQHNVKHGVKPVVSFICLSEIRNQKI